MAKFLLFVWLGCLGCAQVRAQQPEIVERVTPEIVRLRVDGRPMLAVSERLADQLLRAAERERERREFIQHLTLAPFFLRTELPPCEPQQDLQYLFDLAVGDLNTTNTDAAFTQRLPRCTGTVVRVAEPFEWQGRKYKAGYYGTGIDDADATSAGYAKPQRSLTSGGTLPSRRRR